jgi:hypothetical protein
LIRGIFAFFALSRSRVLNLPDSLLVRQAVLEETIRWRSVS